MKEIIDMNTVILTKHAKDRIKERVGIPKRSALKYAQKALDLGISHRDTVGRLNRWFTKLFLEYRTANNTKIYGSHVFLFNDSTLITVLHLPNNFKNIVKGL